MGRHLAGGVAKFGMLGAGLLTVGLSAFVYLGAADRVLGPVAALPLSVLWTVANVVGPALLVPVELEVARTVAHCVAGGLDYRPAVRRITAVAGLGVCAVALGALALHRQLVALLFPGHPELLVALVVITAAFAAQHVTRGVFSGTGQLPRYGAQLLVDGALRGGLALAVVAAGLPLIPGFAAVLALAPAVSVLVTIPVRRSTADPSSTSPPGWRAVGVAVALLVLAQIGSAFVIGGSAIAARVLAGPAELVLAADLIAALLLSRVPLMAFYAVQPTVIPRLTRIARTGTVAEFRRAVVVLVGGTLALGTGAVAAALPLGPWVGTIVFGEGIRITAIQAMWTFAAVVVFVVATLLTQALVALRAHHYGTLVWLGACAVYVALLAVVPLGLEPRILLALLSAVTFATLGAALAVAHASRSLTGGR